MKDKLKIAIFVDWFIPAFRAGGPIKSVSNMVDQLKKDFDLYVFTSAYDLGSELPLDVEVNQWIEKDDYRVKYFTENNSSSKVFKANLDLIKPDIVYVNSMFSYTFAITPIRLAKKMKSKIVLAPRGMLAKGALNIKKGKKSVYLKTIKTLGWHKTILFHATSVDEKDDIYKIFGAKAKCVLAHNLATPIENDQPKSIKKKSGELKLVFLSRISRVKNLKAGIKFLGGQQFDGEISLDVYGPIEDKDYFQECKNIAEKQNKIQITFHGPLASNKVEGTLTDYHFLFLPTMNENFGHVITESFAAGVPVIISDQTPWKKLWDKKIGFDISLADDSEWKDTISFCLKLKDDEYQSMSQAAREFYVNKVMDDQNVKNLIALFNEAYVTK